MKEITVKINSKTHVAKTPFQGCPCGWCPNVKAPTWPDHILLILQEKITHGK